jgi:hypothetical protein
MSYIDFRLDDHDSKQCENSVLFDGNKFIFVIEALIFFYANVVLKYKEKLVK